jgi:hypothetical protein
MRSEGIRDIDAVQWDWPVAKPKSLFHDNCVPNHPDVSLLGLLVT